MKITEARLRKLIREEALKSVNENHRSKRNSLRFLLEEDEKPSKGAEKTGDKETFMLGGKPLEEPEGTSFTDQTNFADFKSVEDCRELLTQLASGDASQPIYRVMKSDPGAVVGWLKKTFGNDLDELASRIVTIGSKLPKSGLSKADMPFLPGPPDAVGSVDQVQDALTPGGQYNVDFRESLGRRPGVLVERWQRLAGILNEDTPPPAPNSFIGLKSKDAQDYMTSGIKDGKPEDDKAAVVLNPSIAATDAIPTQRNVLLPKSLSMAVAGIEGGPIGAYFSTNNEILDGHHRWSATMLNNPGAAIGGFAAIDLDAMGGTKKALQHLTAIGNALGNATKTK